MPKDDPKFISIIAGTLSIVGIISLLIAIKAHGGKKFQEWITISLIFGLGVAIGLAPWMVKHFKETEHIGMALLTGSGGTFNPDFTRIHSKEAIIKINQAALESSISSSGQSMNEDF